MIIFCFVFRAHVLEGTLRKARACSAEEETPKNERGKEGRGQESEQEEWLPSPASLRKCSHPSHTTFMAHPLPRTM